jgi:raffinose/stachyose/melibiose transport system permease protein
MAAGAFVLFAVLVFFPGILGIFYSFTNWNSYSSDIRFVGMKNYAKAFSNTEGYTGYIINTLLFTLFTTLLKTILGILLALLFNGTWVRGNHVHRMIIFSPQVMSYLIVGLVFKSLLNPSHGFVNVFLKWCGLGFLAQSWLSKPGLAFASVVLVDTWKGVGYIMMVVLAGLQVISTSYYEAASMDGASFWQQTRYITMPLLAPVLINVTVLNLTYGFRVFDIIYSLTHGGPGHATEVLNTAVYAEFAKGNYAMGTALSSILFVFVMSISYFLLKAMDVKEEADENA